MFTFTGISSLESGGSAKLFCCLMPRPSGRPHSGWRGTTEACTAREAGRLLGKEGYVGAEVREEQGKCCISICVRNDEMIVARAYREFGTVRSDLR